MMREADDILCTPLGFIEEILGLPLYEWQAEVLQWFEDAGYERVKGTLCTPNGAGKSERIVAGLVLWWLSIYKRGKAVVTTKSGMQLDSQVMPAIKAHAAKFEGWRFNEREVHTPTGGLGVFFTTDENQRAEGHHPVEDGPVLIIVDEAKSVPEGIFEALDRCNFAALLYVSSPGVMAGRFYDSQTKEALGFHRKRIGLDSCPHIPKERIDDIIRTYGENSPFTRSTLHGEFMAGDERSRFDADGLARLRKLSESARPPMWMRLNRQEDKSVVNESVSEGEAWLSVRELPRPGCRYLVSVDVATGAEQQKGSNDPDAHSVKVIRDAYTDTNGAVHNVACVARIVPKFSNVNLDVLADFVDRLSRFYGRCIAFIEVNGPGLALIELMKPWGCPVHKRQRYDSLTSRTEEKPGWNTNKLTKPLVIASLATLIRENALDEWDVQTIDQLQSFVTNPDGSESAVEGAHDDDVMSAAIGVHNRQFGTTYRVAPVNARAIEEARGYRRDGREMRPVSRGECS